MVLLIFVLVIRPYTKVSNAQLWHTLDLSSLTGGGGGSRCQKWQKLSELHPSISDSVKNIILLEVIDAKPLCILRGVRSSKHTATVLLNLVAADST